MKLSAILYLAALPWVGAGVVQLGSGCGWERMVVILLLGVLLGIPLPGAPSWWRRGGGGGDDDDTGPGPGG